MQPWRAIARRIAEGLNIRPGELIQVRDHIDRPEVLQEVLLAVEWMGATPLLDLQSPAYLNRWLAAATPEAIGAGARHRLRWLHEIDRVIALSGGMPDFGLAAPAALAAWQTMDEAITAVEESRQLPMLVVAVPTAQRAARLGMALAELEAHVLPALELAIPAGQQAIAQTLAAVAGQRIAITTGGDHTLYLYRGHRRWHGDDGVIDDADRRHGTIVSNLPAGSVYTTVLEEKTHGTLYLPTAPHATGVRCHFTAGRITGVEAESGGEAFTAWLDGHSGAPRRVSHIGIGLNPYLHHPIGWTLVDEHIAGALFLALGENRYMGGENASSLNHDFALTGASLAVDGKVVVQDGKLV